MPSQTLRVDEFMDLGDFLLNFTKAHIIPNYILIIYPYVHKSVWASPTPKETSLGNRKPVWENHNQEKAELWSPVSMHTSTYNRPAKEIRGKPRRPQLYPKNCR